MVTYLEAQRSLNSHSVVQSIFSNIKKAQLILIYVIHTYTHTVLLFNVLFLTFYDYLIHFQFMQF